jgi:CRISPR/Cas system-associated exonuclease Cas4 (RecB family)
MSSFDFTISNIRFSYSSVSSFDNCQYSFKLAYIDAVQPRANNYFGEYGTLVHECFEKYFSGELDVFELSQYYNERYREIIKTPAPHISPGLEEKYRLQGQNFFDNFSFDKEAYDILLVEDKIDFKLNDIDVVAKPDLVLKEKSSGKILLYDYKTATPFWTSAAGKEMSDKKKLEGYYKQMHLYTYALRETKGFNIDAVSLWFVRLGKIVTVPWDKELEDTAIGNFTQTVEKIKNEEIFAYNNSSPFFCNELCGVREFCKYR